MVHNAWLIFHLCFLLISFVSSLLYWDLSTLFALSPPLDSSSPFSFTPIGYTLASIHILSPWQHLLYLHNFCSLHYQNFFPQQSIFHFSYLYFLEGYIPWVFNSSCVSSFFFFIYINGGIPCDCDLFHCVGSFPYSSVFFFSKTARIFFTFLYTRVLYNCFLIFIFCCKENIISEMICLDFLYFVLEKNKFKRCQDK